MPEAGEVAEAKRDLRRRLIAARRKIGIDELTAARLAIRTHVLHRLELAAQSGMPWRRVFAFEALADEPGSPALLEGLADHGASIYVPLRRPDHDLDWIRWPDSTTLGLQAVSQASVMLVPALAVDRTGMRIGRGGGSYDRVLPRVPSEVPVAAVLHRGETLEHVPAEAWDCRVHAVVTPDGWFDIVPARTS